MTGSLLTHLVLVLGLYERNYSKGLRIEAGEVAKRSNSLNNNNQNNDS
jgi:hypothetical protein